MLGLARIITPNITFQVAIFKINICKYFANIIIKKYNLGVEGDESMLLRFSVENYQSFRDQVTLELIPNAGSEHLDHIIQSSDEKNAALNCVMIYGANASGKSGLFKAMTQALNILKRSSSLQSNEKLPWNPFLLNNESRNKPTSFEFQFIADNDIRYVYGFSYLPDHISEEYLLAYYSNRPSNIFDYKDGSFKFSSKYAALLNPLVKMNAPNRLFLATADAWNAEPVKAAYNWLTGKIDTFTDIDNIAGRALDYYRNDTLQGRHTFIDFAVNMMKETDINISDIDLSFSDIPGFDDKFSIKGFQANAHHRIGGNDYLISLENESLGTHSIFFMASILKKVFEQKGVLAIDEIDRSLHPMLVRYLIEKFSAPENKGAQLIATTHDVFQLDLNEFRRDQIYFTEKNPSTGVSDLYSLCDFSPRKNEKVDKNYLLGRYGAIPCINEAAAEKEKK